MYLAAHHLSVPSLAQPGGGPVCAVEQGLEVDPELSSALLQVQLEPRGGELRHQRVVRVLLAEERVLALEVVRIACNNAHAAR